MNVFILMFLRNYFTLKRNLIISANIESSKTLYSIKIGDQVFYLAQAIQEHGKDLYQVRPIKNLFVSDIYLLLSLDIRRNKIFTL
jgi:hypothetical protein